MPFCPQCHYEYVESTAECPDCLVKLVEKLPQSEKIDAEELKLKEIYSLPGVVYAEMVKEALENEGIHCLIKTDVLTASHLSGGTAAAGNNAKVFVREEDAEKALRILHTMVDHI